MSQSRAQRAYDKRRYKKARVYEAKKYEPTRSPETKIKAREPDNSNIADHEFTEKYSVTYHSCHRFLTRVFGQESNPSIGDLKKAAVMITKNLPLLNEHSEGKYPLMDNYIAIIKSGIVVTILNKKD